MDQEITKEMVEKFREAYLDLGMKEEEAGACAGFIDYRNPSLCLYWWRENEDGTLCQDFENHKEDEPVFYKWTRMRVKRAADEKFKRLRGKK